jgi:hypothetical protein
MRSTRCGAFRSQLLVLLALLATCSVSLSFPPSALGLPAGTEPPSPAAIAQPDGVLSLADGTIQLLGSAPPAPPRLGDYAHYGSFVSAATRLARPSQRFTISYLVTTTPASQVQVDLRGSLDGTRWTEWAVDLPNNSVATLNYPVQWLQYRLTLLAHAAPLPSVRMLKLQPLQAQENYNASAGNIQPAPTFRLRATRQGMVGGRTANGYIIEPKARFVSLPSWRSLAPKGSYEYSVRITYNGRSSVAPVWDVGPYNVHDDYWSFDRERFKDLQRGWPQDHAAFYEGYNGGWGEKGYVRFPTAIDIGDGVWQDDLGIKGDQAEVEVTFLWLGSDPQAGKQPRSAEASEHTVDELSPDFWRNAPVWDRSPVGCGEGRHAFAAPSVAELGLSSRVARWQPILPLEATYDLFVHVPICPAKTPPSAQARYLIQHRDAAIEMLIDQTRQTGWVYLGRFPFPAGEAGYIQLSDVTGEAKRTVWFDQARWVLVK